MGAIGPKERVIIRRDELRRGTGSLPLFALVNANCDRKARASGLRHRVSGMPDSGRRLLLAIQLPTFVRGLVHCYYIVDADHAREREKEKPKRLEAVVLK